MSSRRAYDTSASGASHNDPYQRWIPPGQAESSRSRQKTTTSQPVHDARLGAGRQVNHSRPHTSTRDYQSDTYVHSAAPASSYHNQPSTGKGYRTTHAPSVYPGESQQTQPQKVSNQATQVQNSHYPPQKVPLENLDPRRHLHKNTAAVPSPQSSAESTEENTRNAKHASLRNVHDPRSPAKSSTPTMWIHPSQEGHSSTRKQRQGDTERESEQHMNRTREKHERRREKEKEMLEKERAKEKERTKEKRRASEQIYQGHRNPAKPPSSTRYYQEPRVDDPDSSDSALKRYVLTSRGRHRAEEGVPSHSTVRQNPLL
jgi:hypothetical protein